MYGEITEEELILALGKPLFDLDQGKLVYLEHTLDEEHIIEIEFSGDLEKLLYLSIDG